MKLKITLFSFLLSIVFFSCSSPSETINIPSNPHSTVNEIDYYADTTPSRKWEKVVNKEIEEGRKPVAFFTASWCGPCKGFKALLAQNTSYMTEVLRGSTLIIIDIDEDAEKDFVSANYDVNAVPTFIKLGKDGKQLKRITSAEWEENTAEHVAPVFKDFLKD